MNADCRLRIDAYLLFARKQASLYIHDKYRLWMYSPPWKNKPKYASHSWPTINLYTFLKCISLWLPLPSSVCESPGIDVCKKFHIYSSFTEIYAFLQNSSRSSRIFKISHFCGTVSTCKSPSVLSDENWRLLMSQRLDTTDLSDLDFYNSYSILVLIWFKHIARWWADGKIFYCSIVV